MPRRKRSNFERKVAKSLTDRGVTYRYESRSFKYYIPPYNARCWSCGGDDIWEERVYTPDFYLPDRGIYVETKGKFVATDRKKMKAVRRDNPEIDLRLVFMNDNKLTKHSKTRYSQWAIDNDFLYAIGGVPDEWIKV